MRVVWVALPMYVLSLKCFDVIHTLLAYIARFKRNNVMRNSRTQITLFAHFTHLVSFLFR